MALGLVEADNGEAGAFLQEALPRGPADSRGAADNQAALAVQTAGHRHPPCRP